MTAKKKKPRAYFEIRKLIDPRTGEEVGCLVPRHRADRQMLRDKSLRVGDVVRLPVEKPRNEKFNRLVHGLGQLVREQVEGFEHKDAHATIKQLQSDSGVMCQPVTYSVPGLGTLVRSEPRSLAFDEMDEGEFHQFWRGICAYLVSRYWPGLDEQAIESMIDLMPEVPA